MDDSPAGQREILRLMDITVLDQGPAVIASAAAAVQVGQNEAPGTAPSVASDEPPDEPTGEPAGEPAVEQHDLSRSTEASAGAASKSDVIAGASNISTAASGSANSQSAATTSKVALESASASASKAAGLDALAGISSFDQLLALPLAFSTTDPLATASRASVLVLDPLMGSANEVSSDASSKLLQKMMAAIGLAPADWQLAGLGSQAVRSTAGASDTGSSTAAISLATLMQQRAIRALILQVPQSHLDGFNQRLLLQCDQRVQGQVDSTGTLFCAARMPQMRTSFCCLVALQDLLREGELKRHAWETLKALQQSMSVAEA